VKTRLAAAIGGWPAARVYRAFLEDTRRRFGGSAVGGVEHPWTLWWAFDPPDSPFASDVARTDRTFPQRRGNLGERMAGAMEEVLSRGYRRVVLVGSDLPHLPLRTVEEAFARLEGGAPLLIGPAEDGGYYLIGAVSVPPVFTNVAWGSRRVLEATIELARAAGIEPLLMSPLYDIDGPEDLERLREDLRTGKVRGLDATRAALETIPGLGYKQSQTLEMQPGSQSRGDEPVGEPNKAVSPASAANSPESPWGDFRLALSMLTILGRAADPAKQAIGRAALFYPLVGLAIGLGVSVLDWVLRTFLSQEMTSVLLVGALALASGGRQLDGFANTADGLIGFRGREWAMATIRDRRIGTSGAAAVFFLLILKVRSFDLLSDPIRFVGVLIPPLIGRWAIVALAHRARAAGAPDGREFDPGITSRELAIASSFGALVVLATAGALGLLVLIVAGLATLGLRLYFDRRLGGITAQGLDAAAEVVEALALIVFALAS
jgi:rSAM/selenodomain-associated transferase 1